MESVRNNASGTVWQQIPCSETDFLIFCLENIIIVLSFLKKSKWATHCSSTYFNRVSLQSFLGLVVSQNPTFRKFCFHLQGVCVTWLFNWMISFVGRSFECIDRLNDWLSDSLIYQLIDWSVDWLVVLHRGRRVTRSSCPWTYWRWVLYRLAREFFFNFPLLHMGKEDDLRCIPCQRLAKTVPVVTSTTWIPSWISEQVRPLNPLRLWMTQNELCEWSNICTFWCQFTFGIITVHTFGRLIDSLFGRLSFAHSIDWLITWSFFMPVVWFEDCMVLIQMCLLQVLRV